MVPPLHVKEDGFEVIVYSIGQLLNEIIASSVLTMPSSIYVPLTVIYSVLLPE